MSEALRWVEFAISPTPIPSPTAPFLSFVSLVGYIQAFSLLTGDGQGHLWTFLLSGGFSAVLQALSHQNDFLNLPQKRPRKLQSLLNFTSSKNKLDAQGL